MKRALLSVLAVIAMFSSFAQPALSAAGNNPVVGDKFFILYSDTAGVSMGASGATVTWDLSGLTTLFTDSVEYIACAPTPYCDSFPGSTLASTTDGSWFDYYTTDVNQFASVGSYGSSLGTFYSDPGAIIKYPMTYSTVSVDSSVYVSGGSAFVNVVDSFNGDAYGTLILPSGTYTNVLRVHVVSHERDSFDFGTPTVDTFRSESYYWYTPGCHHPLLVMYYDTTGSGTSYLSNVWYSPVTSTTSVADATGFNVHELSVYPNPANDNLQLRLFAKAKTSATITVTDMTARLASAPMNRELQPGYNSVSYNTASLPAGMYLLRVNTATENFVRKISIVR
jgi:hypothetical protein